MPIALVGLSFRTAPVAVREKLAQGWGVRSEGEAITLATCNRFEIYAANQHADPSAALATARAIIQSACAISVDALTPHLYQYVESAATQHLFTVAAGLDSMILGESQILGQVGDALQNALAHGTAGRTLAALFRYAIVAGRRVRNETAIGQGSGSVSHAAVALARQTLGDLRDRHVLLIGAGKMAEIAAHTLADAAVGAVRVLNRDPTRAATVAAAIGGTVCGWDALPDALAWADVVITSTGAPHTLIHAQTVLASMAERLDRPLLIIDLAVPRDVDRVVGTLPNVSLVDIDALQDVVVDGLRDRASFIPAAETIVAEEVLRFTQRLIAQDVAPTIADLRDRAEQIRATELQKAMRRLAALSPQEQRAIEAMSVAIVNKLLHEPTIELKRHAADVRFTQTARALFGLQADVE